MSRPRFFLQTVLSTWREEGAPSTATPECSAHKNGRQVCGTHCSSSADPLAVVVGGVGPPVGLRLHVAEDHVLNGDGEPRHLQKRRRGSLHRNNNYYLNPTPILSRQYQRAGASSMPLRNSTLFVLSVHVRYQWGQTVLGEALLQHESWATASWLGGPSSQVYIHVPSRGCWPSSSARLR